MFGKNIFVNNMSFTKRTWWHCIIGSFTLLRGRVVGILRGKGGLDHLAKPHMDPKSVFAIMICWPSCLYKQ